MTVKVLTVAVAVILTATATGSPGSAPPPAVDGSLTRPLNVLLLTAVPSRTAALVAFEEAFRSALRSRLARPVTLHFEYSDLAVFGGEPYERQLRELLRLKYERVPLDLVVVTHSRALRFVATHRLALFPRVPVVFGGADRSAVEGVPLGPDMTGVWLSVPWARTLEAALHLQPGTRHVLILAGASSTERTWIARAKGQLEALARRVTIEYPPEQSLEEIEKGLGALHDGTIVVVGSFTRDVTGHNFVGGEAVQRMVAVSRVPIYAVNETLIGTGVVGGDVVSWVGLGDRVGELAQRVLAGERPPSGDAGPSSFVFDARQLRRWGLDEGRLPAGSEVRFRQASAWDLYGWQILGAGAVIATQGLLISRLLVSRAQRRRAQATLAERLRFETLLSDLVATFVTPLHPAEVDRTLHRMLERVAEELAVDRAVVAETDPARTNLRITHSWSREGIPSAPAEAALERFPWMCPRLRAGDVVCVNRTDRLPETAATDRASLTELGIRSLVAVPIVLEGHVVGALVLSTLRSDRVWPDELVPRLQVLADVFAGVLARARAERAAQASEEQRQQAEEEAQRQREDLAHVLRVTTLGELAAALAHEISQPLGAILSNSQAARRLLDSGRAGPDDVGDALADIGHDARRAAQIIHRLRGMFSKNHVKTAAVDVNTLVQEVVGLLRTNLGRRAILVRFALGEALPVVEGDAIQLQQVVLNLVMNAAEAIEANEADGRIILVETRLSTPGRVVIAVRDNGIGLKEEELERVFEHFVSSKPNGLGMGLAISRSIVQAHGGRIWATRNHDAGLTMHVELPCGAEPLSPA